MSINHGAYIMLGTRERITSFKNKGGQAPKRNIILLPFKTWQALLVLQSCRKRGK